MPETVESAIPSSSAISAAVKRSRRMATISRTRSSDVRFASPRGREERSSKPGGPSSRYLPTHLRAQRTLTPAAAAAAVSVHPSTTTRSARRRRPVQLSAALP
jgi:hypothetical protein